MHSVFENMTDHINMWREVKVNELFHDFAYIANEETTWSFQIDPEYLIADIYHGLDAGRHNLTFGIYKD